MKNNMQKIILTVGIPACGKSTWAKAEVAKDPENWCRINNDDLRAMFNGTVFSQDYEKFVTETRNFLIREALKRGKNVILDNVNLNRIHFNNTVKIAKSVNGNFEITEMPFYIPLEEALARNAKREGSAKVPEEVIHKFWKESNKEQFKFYKPKMEIVKTFTYEAVKVDAPAHNPKLPDAVICDLDGTLALLNGRSPYDASTCDKDLPNVPVIETLRAHYALGRKIIFCSGREDKYLDPTIKFIEKYVKVTVWRGHMSDPDYWRGSATGDAGAEATIPYKLHMRKTGDMRKDAIIKEEIYNEHIKDKYNVLLVLDDRDQVVEFWRSKGLTCFQVAPGAF